jgi:peroxiredoxin
VFELDGFRLAIFAALVLAVVWAVHRYQIRALTVPTRPAVQLGASLGAGVLGLLALGHSPGSLGAGLAAAAVAGAVAYFVATSSGGLPSLTPTIDIGTVAPDFAATDCEGGSFRLGAHRGRAVLIKFFRAHWSAYCLAELERWEMFRPQLELFGVKVVALSADPPQRLARLKRGRRLGMALLADPDLSVIALYGLRQERAFVGLRGWRRPLAIPTTVLIDAQGIVRWIDQPHDYRIRTDIDRVMAAVNRGLHGPGFAARGTTS